MSIVSSVNQASSLSSLSSVSGLNQSRARPEALGQRPPPPPPDDSKMASAINKALASLSSSASSSSATTEANGTSSTDSAASESSTTTDASQALSQFMQSLFDTLRSQSGDADSDSQVDALTQGGARRPPPPPDGGGGRLETDLQSLINQLTSGSESDSESDALSNLKDKFQALLKANGMNGDDNSLTAFLQNLKNNLQGASNVGSAVSTQA